MAILTDCDAFVVPLHREHTAALCVENRSIGRTAPFGDTTASIVVDVAVTLQIRLSVRILSQARSIERRQRGTTAGVPQ